MLVRRTDDRPGIFLTRWLEQKMPKLYEKRYPTLHGSNGEDVPINFDLEPGVTELVEESISSYGSADLISFDADDYGTVDLSIEERRFPLKVYGTAIRWNDRELVAAARGQVRLKELRLTKARYYIEEKINRVTYFGEPKVPGFYGLLNNPDVPVDTRDTISYYTTATPDELCQLFFDIANATDEETNMVEETNVFLVSTHLYNHISTKRVTDGNDLTVLQYILRNSPFIKEIRRRNELKNDVLVANGVETGDRYERIVSYSLNRDTLERYAEPIQVTTPLRLSLHNWTVGMFCVTSPVIVHYPLALRYTKINRKGYVGSS